MSRVANMVQNVGDMLGGRLSMEMKQTFYLRSFGLTQVPMIFYVGPVVEALDDSHSVVRIPLNWRTKNHLGSMYFGALSVGADCSAGLLGMHHIRQIAPGMSLQFKSFKAEFLRRPEDDVSFICHDGRTIAAAVRDAAATGQRVNCPMTIEAWLKGGSDPVARFELLMSLKQKKS